MYWQWLHRYLQQISKVSRELIGRGYRGYLAICNSFLKRLSHAFYCAGDTIIQGLLSHVQAMVAPVPATIF
jgi:hypothetical protein